MKLTSVLFIFVLVCYAAAEMPARKNERVDEQRPIDSFRGNDRREVKIEDKRRKVEQRGDNQFSRSTQRSQNKMRPFQTKENEDFSVVYRTEIPRVRV